MADQNVSYKLNLNRNKTKKWQTAKQVDYGGDDWGEEEYEEYDPAPPAPVPPSVPAASARQQARGPNPTDQSQRSFPESSTINTNRLSYEQNDDRRQLSRGWQQSTNAAPVGPVLFQRPNIDQRQQPSLHVETQQERTPVRSNRMSEYAPIPVIDPPDHRPPISKSTIKSSSPVELPASGVTNRNDYNTANFEAQPDSYSFNRDADSSSQQQGSLSSPTKVLPFIRPSDIYKRVEEEREKERRSQESTRPSFDSTVGEDTTSTGASTKTENTIKSDIPIVLDRIDEKQPSLSKLGQLSEPQDAARSIPGQSSFTNSGTPVPAITLVGRVPQAGLPIATESSTPKGVFSSLSPTLGQDPIPHELDDRDPRSLTPGRNFNNSISVTTSDGSRPDELSHQPSLGYTSVVHKAFDDEGHDASSPSTTNESLLRSNSASTSEISPIITKKSSTGFDATASTGLQDQAIPEEPFFAKGRPESTATIKAGAFSATSTSTDPPIIPPGFRRDSATPSPGNSPARRPQSIVIPDAVKGETAAVSSALKSPQDEDTSTSNTVNIQSSTLHHAENQLTPGYQSSDITTSMSRTASQDYQQWTEQRRSFNAKHGIDDASNASPVSSNPISRSDTPVKSAPGIFPGQIVTDPASSSVASSSEHSAMSRPPPQDRFDSFRPSLPGGWQSDATITSTLGNQEADSQKSQGSLAASQSRNLSTESIPTAKPPRDIGSSTTSPTDKAFAAAAAAGSALAGSFSGSAFSKDTRIESGSDTANESDNKIVEGTRASQSATQDFATQPSRNVVTHGEQSQTSTEAAPSSIQSDVNFATSDHSKDTPTEPTSSQRQTPVEFPAPLRMSKVNESNPLSPRPSLFTPTTIASDEDPEQLQHDIVQSLTPKPSNVEVSTAAEPQPYMKREDSYDSVLPAEYSSYWQNELARSETVHDKVTKDDAVQNTATLSGPLVDEYPVAEAIPEPHTHTQRPSLEQRFSFEKPFSVPPLEARQDSPTSQQLNRNNNATEESVQHLKDSPRLLPAITETQKDIEEQPTIDDAELVTTSAHVNDTTSQGHLTETDKAPMMIRYPTEKVDFQSILSFNDPHRRIAAFDENRRLYSESNGLLDHWLASLNIPEHADVFVTSRQQRVHQSTPQAAQTPPRSNTTMPSSTRQMQEDGKRILAVAGKYGGKAGIAAKGLFAKGKDKFRTASAGDKQGPSVVQTKSLVDDASSPTSPESQRSIYPSNAPQLPTPTLTTPVVDYSWSLISSTIDQIFIESSSPVPRHDPEEGQQLSQLGIRGEITRRNDEGVATQLHGEAQPKSATPAARDLEQEEHKRKTPITTPLDGQIAVVANGQTNDLSDSKQSDTLPEQSEAFTSKALPSLPPGKANVDNISKSSSPSQRRRNSAVSEVSSVGQVPKPQTMPADGTQHIPSQSEDSNVTRSNTRTQEVPIFLSHSLSKEAEARQDVRATSSLRHTSLPPYSSPALDRSSQRMASGASIVPMGTKPADRRGSNRPFSFVGTETTSSVPSYHPGGSPPPITPIDGQPQKAEGDQKTVEPDIMEHPAYRQDNDTESDQQLVENPLPSSRRPPEELEMARRQSRQPVAMKEPESEGYRIPGPYVQEYRSPRPKGSSDQFKSPSTPRTTTSPPLKTSYSTTIEQPVRPQPPSEEHQLGPLADHNLLAFQPIGPRGHIPQPALNNGHWEPHTRVELNRTQDTEKGRNRPFGNIFRNRADSRNRDEKQEPVYSQEHLSNDKKKRKAFFRLNTRPESPSRRLERLPEEHDGQGHPSQSGHRRMLSSDLLKNKPFGLKSAEGKRKRSSGLAGLFLRSASKEKSRPSTSLSQRSDFDGTPQQVYNPYGQYPDNMQTGIMHQNNGSRTDHYSYQHGYQGESDDRFASMESKPHHVPGPYERSDVGIRSDHLWVDTTGYNHQNIGNALTSSANTPYTAGSPMPTTSSSTAPTTFSATPPVPVTRARRDISYGQDRPYIPPPSKNAMAEHVKSLKKRSRSPRLGKPPSDEFLHAQFGVVPGAADAPDPAENLGTFYSKKASPVGIPRSNEEQEKPWTLTLPTGHEDNTRDLAKAAESTSEPRGRNRYTQGQTGNLALTDSQNISDILKKSGELSLAPAVASRETASTQENDGDAFAYHDTSQKSSTNRESSLLARTPSPFLSNNDSSRHIRTQGASERVTESSGPPRSTTPATSPPVSFRNFLNTTNEAARSTSPLPMSARGSTIVTTTTTTTSRGSQGLVTNMNTTTTPNNVVGSSTPIDRPPSVAPERFSHVRSSTPLQQFRSATPVQTQQTATLPQRSVETQSSTADESAKPPQQPEISEQIRAPTPVLNGPATFATRENEHDKQDVTEKTTNSTRMTQSVGSGPNVASSSLQERDVSPPPDHRIRKSLSGANEPHPLKMFAPVELPGSKPDGYESEDEPVMSATFFPGQEWMPTSFDRWED